MRALQPLGCVMGTDYPEVDLARADSVREMIRQARPAVVLNAAAYTAVDKAESEPEAAARINSVAPGVMAEEARRQGALLVHFSTDYVFDGNGDRPYAEEMPTNPLSVYGRTKLAGDQTVQQTGGRFLIFRLCWVYGGRGQNFLRTMLRLATTRDELRVVDDQRGAPTWCRMIAEGVTLAVAQTLRSPEPETCAGLYHMASAGVTTWHGFARAIWEHIPAGSRRSAQVVPIGTADYAAPARRPANSVLDCSKLARVFGVRLPDWRTGLRQVLESPVEGFESLKFIA